MIQDCMRPNLPRLLLKTADMPGMRLSAIGDGPAGRPIHCFNALYQDIVKNERIIFTEQGANLDGFDDPKVREHGAAELLDALGAELARQPANT